MFLKKIYEFFLKNPYIFFLIMCLSLITSYNIYPIYYDAPHSLQEPYSDIIGLWILLIGLYIFAWFMYVTPFLYTYFSTISRNIVKNIDQKIFNRYVLIFFIWISLISVLGIFTGSSSIILSATNISEWVLSYIYISHVIVFIIAFIQYIINPAIFYYIILFSKDLINKISSSRMIFYGALYWISLTFVIPFIGMLIGWTLDYILYTMISETAPLIYLRGWNPITIEYLRQILTRGHDYTLFSYTLIPTWGMILQIIIASILMNRLTRYLIKIL